jgi:hypothetical protein
MVFAPGVIPEAGLQVMRHPLALSALRPEAVLREDFVGPGLNEILE